MLGQASRPSPTQLKLAELRQNSGKLRLEIHLNKSRYFAYEVPQVTISAVNPTGEILEIPQLFHSKTGSMTLFRNCEHPSRYRGLYCELPGTVWGALSQRDFLDVSMGADYGIQFPTQLIHPSERIEVRFDVPSEACKAIDMLGQCWFPTFEGSYKLIYETYQSMASAEVEFSIVEPEIESAATVVVGQTEVKNFDGSIGKLASELEVLSLGYEGSRFLAVAVTARHFGAGDKERLFANPKVSPDNRIRNEAYKIVSPLEFAAALIEPHLRSPGVVEITCRGTNPGELATFSVDLQKAEILK
jgi:hypothetical protein